MYVMWRKVDRLCGIVVRVPGYRSRGQSDSRLSVKLVPTFADRECHVFSVTDPYGRTLGFLDLEPLLFLSSSSSIVLTRLGGPRSRPTTSQKIW
jgi:hypothetical protein